MKKFVAILTLPFIFSLVFFAEKLYVADQYFAAYSLLATWLTAFVYWIKSVGQLFVKKPATVVPAVPRAYITKLKRA